MERNVQKNGLVNLVAAVMIFIAAFVVTCFVNSLAGQACSIFLGLGALVAFAGWFQMRLEENERLEKLEVEELARAKGESTLFAAKDAEVFPAQRAREQFEKFFVPGFGVLLFLLEAGGAWLLWRWVSKTATGVVPDRAMASLALFGIFALLLFLLGRFSVTIARLENHRLLRPGASFLLAGAYLCFVTALGIAGVKAEFPRVDFYLARALCVLLGLMAAEMLATLLLEIYRPRVKGRIARPACSFCWSAQSLRCREPGQRRSGSISMRCWLAIRQPATEFSPCFAVPSTARAWTSSQSARTGSIRSTSPAAPSIALPPDPSRTCGWT